MLPGNMDKHVRLHSTDMVAARARPLLLEIRIGGILHFRVCLRHMLLETTLLNESLATNCTVVFGFPGMLLQMIEHRILTLRLLWTVRTEKIERITLLNADIVLLWLCHLYFNIPAFAPLQLFDEGAI